jgi:hypothetical protein
MAMRTLARPGVGTPLYGKLEDVAVVDVLHLLSVSRKSGVLAIDSAFGKASFVLRNGDVCAAMHPSPDVHVGRILVERGTLTNEDMLAAVADGQPELPVVARLIAGGKVTRDEGWAALAHLVEQTVAAIRDWPAGSFSFEPSSPEALDSFAHTPAVVEAIGTSPQARQLLGQAVQVLDDRNREDTTVSADAAAAQAPVPGGTAPPDAGGDAASAPNPSPVAATEAATGASSPALASGLPADDDGAVSPSFGRLREAVLCSSDGVFRNLLGAACRRAGVWAYTGDSEREVMGLVQRGLRNGKATPVLLDLTATRSGGLSRRRLVLATHLKRDFPAVPLLALGPRSHEAELLALRAGARAYFAKQRGQAEVASLADLEATVALVLEALAACSREQDAVADELGVHQRELATLRERVLQLTRPGSAADVSLLLLKHVAQYLRRCVLFVVRPHDLLGLGGFGLARAGEPASASITGLRLPLHVPSLPRRVLEQREMHHGPVDDKLLHDHLFTRIGPPASREGLLLPLHGRDHPIALIYADHGDSRVQPIRTDTLEILACLASLSLEIALYRRTRLAGNPPLDAGLASTPPHHDASSSSES